LRGWFIKGLERRTVGGSTESRPTNSVLRENFTGRATLCGAASKHITLRHSRRLNLAIEAWDLFGTWVLGFGICLRSIISAREKRDLWQRTDFLV